MLIRITENIIYNTDGGAIEFDPGAGVLLLDCCTNDANSDTYALSEDMARDAWSKLCVIADHQEEVLESDMLRARRELRELRKQNKS